SALEVISQHHRFCRSGIRGLNTAITSPWVLRGEEIDLSAPIAYQQLIQEGGLDFLYRGEVKFLDSLLPLEAR
ncbi:MAG: hypothetical protein EB015_21765, partial [Methylocystaceae bacterium]|nr:hypothetical protein [Methylocystaceae bacterium]